MKYKIILIALTTLFISCSNDKKTTEKPKEVVKTKSDLLLVNSATKFFSNPSNVDTLTVIINGKSLLKSKAIFKVTSANGKQISSDTIPTIQLLHSDYKTANSSLQEVQIRETVSKLFKNDSYLNYFTKDAYAKAEIVN
ncbi:hypothetical protein [Cellulophaga tyrosinoxydans]|uniref:Uncharacterized protein n=1 Tax=Cellulophaga tyrosinoxydans TaxID=504486 RepID=A0A1W1YAE3_9FLAO|nr:hypothetical protein [Cellulophaga tyrosinoxydans]SMC32718.1 hypothetical protein SAMN05660703_0157 [Cellulophaga tyrosinoxydans]